MEVSYLDFILPELFTVILESDLDPDAEILLKLTEAYPYLIDNIVDNFLQVNDYNLYNTIKQIRNDMNLIISVSEIFVMIINYVIRLYDTSDEMNFMMKYHRMIKEFVDYDPDYEYKNYARFYNDNKLLYDIIIHLLFYKQYPSIIKYYYKHINKLKWLSLDDLYDSLEKLHYEEYHIIQTKGLDEDTIIDILKLWEKDNSEGYKIRDISISEEDYEELREHGDFGKLVKFLEDNKVEIL